MSYPSHAAIQQYARDSGVPLSTVYAFAAINRHIPANLDQILTFRAGVDAAARRFQASGAGTGYIDTGFFEFFASTLGRWPNTAEEIHKFATTYGQNEPAPGAYYIGEPGRATIGQVGTVDPLASAVAAGTRDPFGGIQRFWAGGNVNKAILLGGGFLLLRSLSGRRGLF